MSKKLFQEVAQILGQHQVSRELVEDFCTVFKGYNTNFDRHRFVAAIEKIAQARK